MYIKISKTISKIQACELLQVKINVLEFFIISNVNHKGRSTMAR